MSLMRIYCIFINLWSNVRTSFKKSMNCRVILGRLHYYNWRTFRNLDSILLLKWGKENPLKYPPHSNLIYTQHLLHLLLARFRSLCACITTIQGNPWPQLKNLSIILMMIYARLAQVTRILGPSSNTREIIIVLLPPQLLPSYVFFWKTSWSGKVTQDRMMIQGRKWREVGNIRE